MVVHAVILPLRRLRQEAWGFKTSLSYIVRPITYIHTYIHYIHKG